jgi:mannose-6-phosphate isomerase-like protein (cupin superfamily)
MPAMPETSRFGTLHERQALAVSAPDGARVRVLLALQRGSMAVFELEPGQVSAPVRHRSVEELWYVLSGEGEMWRRDAIGEAVVSLQAGLCLSLPLDTDFQFRCPGHETLRAVAVTLPAWPGADEALPVSGRWMPTVA